MSIYKLSEITWFEVKEALEETPRCTYLEITSPSLEINSPSKVLLFRVYGEVGLRTVRIQKGRKQTIVRSRRIVMKVLNTIDKLEGTEI